MAKDIFDKSKFPSRDSLTYVDDFYDWWIDEFDTAPLSIPCTDKQLADLNANIRKELNLRGDEPHVKFNDVVDDVAIVRFH